MLHNRSVHCLTFYQHAQISHTNQGLVRSHIAYKEALLRNANIRSVFLPYNLLACTDLSQGSRLSKSLHYFQGSLAWWCSITDLWFSFSLYKDMQISHRGQGHVGSCIAFKEGLLEGGPHQIWHYTFHSTLTHTGLEAMHVQHPFIILSAQLSHCGKGKDCLYVEWVSPSNSQQQHFTSTYQIFSNLYICFLDSCTSSCQTTIHVYSRVEGEVHPETVEGSFRLGSQKTQVHSSSIRDQATHTHSFTSPKHPIRTLNQAPQGQVRSWTPWVQIIGGQMQQHCCPFQQVRHNSLRLKHP